MTCLRLPVAVFWAVLCSGVPLGRAVAESVWLAPKLPYPQAHVSGVEDLMELFKPGAPWRATAKGLQTFQISTGFLVGVSDDELATIVGGLNRLNIALSLSSLAQNTIGQRSCGQGVEGYGNTDQAAKLADKIKRAGGSLKYVIMDEPLYFGHYFKGPTACHSTIDNVADRVSGILAEYIRVFPDVIIGDNEPVGAAAIPDWDQSMASWVGAFRAKVGRPLAFVIADVNWDTAGYAEAFKRFASGVKANNLGLGVIYNGKGSAKSDEEWVASALDNIHHVETMLAGPPDEVVFASWVPHPTRLLPESSPGTYTYLIREYLERHGCVNAK